MNRWLRLPLPELYNPPGSKPCATGYGRRGQWVPRPAEARAKALSRRRPKQPRRRPRQVDKRQSPPGPPKLADAGEQRRRSRCIM